MSHLQRFSKSHGILPPKPFCVSMNFLLPHVNQLPASNSVCTSACAELQILGLLQFECYSGNSAPTNPQKKTKRKQETTHCTIHLISYILLSFIITNIFLLIGFHPCFNVDSLQLPMSEFTSKSSAAPAGEGQAWVPKRYLF